MKNPIKRKALAVGSRIISTAQPSMGKVFECIAIHPVGYNPQAGGYRHFVEYDFREVESHRTRTGFTLNYINRYFAPQA